MLTEECRLLSSGLRLPVAAIDAAVLIIIDMRILSSVGVDWKAYELVPRSRAIFNLPLANMFGFAKLAAMTMPKVQDISWLPRNDKFCTCCHQSMH